VGWRDFTKSAPLEKGNRGPLQEIIIKKKKTAATI